MYGNKWTMQYFYFKFGPISLLPIAVLITAGKYLSTI